MTPASGQSPGGPSRPSAATTAPTSAPVAAEPAPDADAAAPGAPAEQEARRRGQCLQAPCVPGYWALRVAASCHFAFGAVCFVAGLCRLALLAQVRWSGDDAFYARGPRIMRTFIVAAVGLVLFGVGTALHALRDVLRSRYRRR